MRGDQLTKIRHLRNVFCQLYEYGITGRHLPHDLMLSQLFSLAEILDFG